MIPKALNTSQFAEYIETIKMLYKVDDDFKTLCDDYLTSKTSLEKFKEKSVEDKQRELEYKRLSLDLEKEILEYVIKRS
ncbi:hypothetical protein [Flavitalea sp.]|nr:hypothetical protein [Flavitalea sp.]